MARVPLGPLADVEQLQPVEPPFQRSCSSSTRQPRHALHRPLLLPPRGHAAGEVAGDVGEPDAHRPARPASRASSSSRPTSTSGCPGSASHASRVPKPPRSAVMQTAAGMCASSNWSSVRTSTTSAPSRSACSHLARGERVHVDRLDHERPAVQRDDVLEVRRLRRRGRRWPAARSRPRPAPGAAAGWRARTRSSSETFRSMPGPPHIEPPRCPGQTSHVSGSASSWSCSEWKMPRAPSALSTARSGPCDVAHEQAVAAQHGPRLARSASASISAKAVCSGRWPGVWSARTRDAAELELPAVVERLVVVVGRRLAVDVDRRAGGRGEPAVPGDVVGVVVRLEDVLDAHAEKRASRRYSSMSSRGSTTAATPASSSPIR